MPDNIRKLTNRLDELRLSYNSLDYHVIEDDDYMRTYQFDTENNRYTLSLTQFPLDDDFESMSGPFGNSSDIRLDIEFTTINLKTNIRGSALTKDNTNKGEPQLIKVYSTIADIVVDYVHEYPEIMEVGCSGDAKKQPIYSRLMKSNIARMLPEFKMDGPTSMVRIEDEDEFDSIQAQRQADAEKLNKGKIVG